MGKLSTSLLVVGLCVSGCWFVPRSDPDLSRAKIVAQAISGFQNGDPPLEDACGLTYVGGAPIRVQVGSRVCRDSLGNAVLRQNLQTWITGGKAIATVQTAKRAFIVLPNLDVAEVEGRHTAVVKLRLQARTRLPPVCYAGRSAEAIFGYAWERVASGRTVHDQ